MTVEKWRTDIDQITNDFIAEFGNLSPEELNWKPSPHVWSVAQNIHHLITINETYYPVIKSIRDNTYVIPWIGRIGFMVRFMGRVILNSVQPDRRKKMKTFPLWQPSSSEFGKDIFEQFRKHQDALKKLIADSQDLLSKETIISSPANKNIVYKLETAFEIIVTHEKRHLEQARELIRLKNKN
jgi:hypothetical protein